MLKTNNTEVYMDAFALKLKAQANILNNKDKVVEYKGEKYVMEFCMWDWYGGPITPMEVNMVWKLDGDSGDHIDGMGTALIEYLTETEPEFIYQFGGIYAEQAPF